MPLIDALGAATVNAPTVIVAGVLGVSFSISATAVTVVPSESAGTSACQLPSSSTSAVIGSSSPTVTLTVAPGSAVPLISVAPATAGLIVGVAV